MVARAAADQRRAVAYSVPTFPFYLTQAQIEDAPVLEIQANEDFSLPIEQLADANAAVTFVANPNSPTGAAAGTDRLDWRAGRLDGLLVIDEAYVDFADQNALALASTRPNVVVLRTLSKGYSLAALRLGFAVANPELMAGLLKTKAIYNVGPLPAAVGAAALADQEYHSQCVAKIRSQRARLADELASRGVTVWPSQGNFLMVSPAGGDALAAYQTLKDRGVLVRYFNKGRMADKLRISVGTERDNNRLLAAWDDGV